LLIQFEPSGPACISADARALSGVMALLLLAVCHAARQRVDVRILIENGHAVCCVDRDGYSVSQEQFGWLHQPFATTQNALFGLGLAQAQRIAQGLGGVVQAAHRSEGGVCVRLFFPLADA
jgi:C4-dicarboxylate-specific signal transduction histidine kinase